MKKKNLFKRWGTFGLVAILSGVFMFQNSIMSMKKASMIELQSNNVVAQADSEYPDWVYIIFAFLEGLATLDEIARSFDVEGWTYCVCYKSNPSDPCTQGHRVSLRHECFTGETGTLPSGGCSAAELDQICIDHFNRNN